MTPAAPASVGVTRAALVATLQRALRALPEVDAVWEGGSAAFGSDDELSDVDVVAVVADDAVVSSFEAVEAALETLSPIVLRLEMPATVGYTQRFYRLRDGGEFLVVDLALIRRSDPLIFREVELHGHGRTWFDRSGVLVETHLDLAADLALARARVPALRTAFEMFQHLVRKELRRGHATDALAFYQAWTLRPLVEALRLLHAPERRGFGLRYLARDLPAEVVRRIEALAFVRDSDHLAQAHEEAVRWFAACIERLQAAGPGSDRR